jgi:single-stranded DNA-binding protein
MSINKVTLSGNLAASPKQTKSVASAMLVIDHSKKKKEDGKFVIIGNSSFKIVAFADITAQLMEFAKGDHITIEGSLHSNPYTDKNGVKTYRTEIHLRAIKATFPKK